MWQLIGERVWPTVLLVGTSILIASVAGMWIGVRAGWHRGSLFDKVSTGTTLALYAMPEFWIGMVLMISLPFFPSGGISSPGADASTLSGWLDVMWHMALPVASLSLVYLAEYAGIMRASLVDELGQDYLTPARAKGLRDDLVRRNHAVPNALLPTMTLIFVNLGFVIGGAITVETVFSWPGLGLLSYEAMRGPDIPLLQAVFLLFSTGVIVCTLLADLLYSVLDPRVSDSDRPSERGRRGARPPRRHGQGPSQGRPGPLLARLPLPPGGPPRPRDTRRVRAGGGVRAGAGRPRTA